MKCIRPKKWSEFQHYKNRCPPWIKLHKALLDDYEFQCLPVASKALAPMLWLLASEYPEGAIPADTRKIAFRLHMQLQELSDAFEPLLNNGFFEVIGEVEKVAIEALAECKQDACLETEKETEKEAQEIIPKPKGFGGERAANGNSPPSWWPKRDRWGRIAGDVDEKIMFDVGKAVLGKSAGGQITKLRKFYGGDMRAVTDLLCQAHEKSDPAQWIGGVLRRAEDGQRDPSNHEVHPYDVYRA